MKNQFLILFIGILLFSCRQSDSTSSDTTDTEVNASLPTRSIIEKSDQPLSNELEKQDILTEELPLKPFDLTQLPTTWIRLTETDSITIIYYTCDGGNMLITINPEDSTILFHGQQEDMKYQFTRFGIAEDSAIHFVIEESNNSNSFSITWIDQNPELATWNLTNYYLGDELHEDLFVSKEHENNYISIEQPCRECWDDEFCNEIESRNE